MAAPPRKTERSKDLRFACRNSDGGRGRKLELEYFINQQCADICHFSETFLGPCQAFRLANYICEPTVRLRAGGGHSHSVPPWYSPPLSASYGPHPLGRYSLSNHFAQLPVKIFAANISPSRPLIGTELFACFGEVCRSCWQAT